MDACMHARADVPHACKEGTILIVNFCFCRTGIRFFIMRFSVMIKITSKSP